MDCHRFPAFGCRFCRAFRPHSRYIWKKKDIRTGTVNHRGIIAPVQHLQQCADADRLSCGGRPRQRHDLRHVHCYSHLCLPCPGEGQGAGHQCGHRVPGSLHRAAPGWHHYRIRRMEVHLCRDHDLRLAGGAPGPGEDQRRVALRARGRFRLLRHDPLCGNALFSHVRADADSRYCGSLFAGARRGDNGRLLPVGACK